MGSELRDGEGEKAVGVVEMEVAWEEVDLRMKVPWEDVMAG